MRLGDLDALYDKVGDHVTSVSVCATAQQAIGQTDFKWRCLEDIRNAPTIDAIPVEWLERTREHYLAVATVLTMWKKEQEAR